MKILQDYIVPVVRVVEDGERLEFGRLHGSAFFINSRGAFISAKHVFENAHDDALRTGGKVALSMRKRGDNNYRYAGHIQDISVANDPYDVVVGYIAEPSRSCFAPGDTRKVWAWTDVYTAGYAASAVSQDGDHVRPDTRSLKGYIVRKVPAGEFLAIVGPHPSAFEVSFSIPVGISGSPLVMRYGPNETPPPGAPFPLLGICTGTVTVSIGAGTENYGVVQDLTPLLDWKPDCLGGETLRDAIRPEDPD